MRGVLLVSPWVRAVWGAPRGCGGPGGVPRGSRPLTGRAVAKGSAPGMAPSPARSLPLGSLTPPRRCHAAAARDRNVI